MHPLALIIILIDCALGLHLACENRLWSQDFRSMGGSVPANRTGADLGCDSFGGSQNQEQHKDSSLINGGWGREPEYLFIEAPPSLNSAEVPGMA